MPLYEYKCNSCGDVFEIIQKFSDSPLSIHEKCGGAVERLISTSALQFKGSGWYVNDYGKGNSKTKPDASTGSDNGDKPKSNGSSESSSKSAKSEKAGKSDSAPPAPAAPSPSKSDTK